MRKTCRNLLLLLGILWINPAAAGVNCNGTPHTRLELAICSDPLLRALDGELTKAYQEARERRLIDTQTIAKQRNQIARQCRREANQALNACLQNAELQSLEWVSAKLGPAQIVASQAASKSWRYDASRFSRTSQLQRQLKVAENRLRSTGDPELTVVTVLSLINVLKEHPDPRGNISKAIGKLDKRLASGCDHVAYGDQWQTVLRKHSLSCSGVQAALFSSADF